MKILINAPFNEDDRMLIVSAAEECQFITPSEIEHADIIIGSIPREYYGKLPGLKWLQLTSAGADKITYGNAISAETLLTTASGAFGEVISEYVLGGILSLYRDLSAYRDNQRAKIWRDAGGERMIFGSRTLILGCGNIGRHIAKRLKAFGAETVGIRRTNKPVPAFDEVHTESALDELLPTADIVILALPRTPETEHILDARRISLMKPGALLVNVGRGAAIDEDALAERLQNGKLFGAVLDVFEEEPLPECSPLWDMENVIITPHISGCSFGHSARTERLIAEICAENVRRYFSGEPLKNVI